MNPLMAPTTYSGQVAEPFSADPYIGLMMYLRRGSPTFPTFIARTFQDRSAFGLPSC